MLEPPIREVETCETLEFLEPLSVRFEGFPEAAFELLKRLRNHPHIEQYREEKEGIQSYIKAPFRAYRDDLAVNWVLPNRLRLETEKNVFSRLLKNDFGAGGCNHHLWMAFYRPGRGRLTDIQLFHSLHPDGFDMGLFVGGQAKRLVRAVRHRMETKPEYLLSLVNPLLQNNYTLSHAKGTGKHRARSTHYGPLEVLPEDVLRADDLWIRRTFPRGEVVSSKGALIPQALQEISDLWPTYLFFVRSEGSAAG